MISPLTFSSQSSFPCPHFHPQSLSQCYPRCLTPRHLHHYPRTISPFSSLSSFPCPHFRPRFVLRSRLRFLHQLLPRLPRFCARSVSSLSSFSLNHHRFH